ncbi:hypothetical protein, partial [Streptomyces sp. SID5789]|uniref:hypothetical protein n=1 Tax=Streptomyces sp. SID5789 TaxID=2690310 RepID=UPI00136F8C37|nr:hypothetical protein [Streptomyces sp. SID5789]
MTWLRAPAGGMRCARFVRAVLFAAVCVLLAALGHSLMSGAAVPWWAAGAGLGGTAGAAWCVAGRERGLPAVVGLSVAAQTVLHRAFAAIPAPSAPAPSSVPGGGGMAQPHMDAGHMNVGVGHGYLGVDHGHLGVAHGHLGVAHGYVHAAHVHLGSGPMEMTGAGHDMSGSSSLGMWAAHTLAALLCGLWLAHGERAAFDLLRAVAGWLAAPLRLPRGTS